MSTTSRVAKNVYRIDSNNGDFMSYLVRVSVSPTIAKSGSKKTFGSAISLRNKWLAEREALKKQKSTAVSKTEFRQWGYM